MPLKISSDGAGGFLLAVKAVPGASRDSIAGVLGDRLKVRVSAMPQDGKANKAICELIAAHLALKPRGVQIASGHASAEKQVRICGLPEDALRSAFDD